MQSPVFPLWGKFRGENGTVRLTRTRLLALRVEVVCPQDRTVVILDDDFTRIERGR